MGNEKYIYAAGHQITAEQLGITLTHEHILFDLSFMFSEPDDPQERELAAQTIRLDNLNWIRSHLAANRDNGKLTDEEDALEELRQLRQAGVCSVVDVSMRGEGFPFNPAAVKRLAEQADLQVITGTGYYTEESIPQWVREASVEEITDELLLDLTEGYPEAAFRAGVIGEIGTSYPIAPTEERVLKAAAAVQSKTQAALYVHPGYSARAPLELANHTEELGADPSKVIICHVDSRLRGDLSVYRELASRGFCLGFDTFGREQYMHDARKQHPSDAQRIEWIRQIADIGYLNKVLISTDVCWKSELTKYGGYGRSHLLHNTIPRMHDEGFSESAIASVLKSNPATVLARPG